jgi:hypothetical protein
MAAQQLLNFIRNTPLVRVTRFDAGPCRLFLKMGSQNPGNSISGFATQGRNSVRPVLRRLS